MSNHNASTGRFFLSILSLTVQAETQYVSDHLVITVRTGQGAQFQIIKTLESGEHVEVLETTDTGYTRIETSDGTEGWVRTQYLATEPVAKEKLERAEAQLLKTKTSLSKIKESYAELSKEHKVLSQNLATISADKKQTLVRSVILEISVSLSFPFAKSTSLS